ncbi:DUF4245 domain-containing protein [Kocuria tytonis]|uniref:DUF4245 domain-containing protein n=1 Tax=Kocuria tytonis TaxID=2054280 RepID=UPI001F1D0482|nr:DUF4245 domain-containing protein [Kocuria tytonis]
MSSSAPGPGTGPDDSRSAPGARSSAHDAAVPAASASGGPGDPVRGSRAATGADGTSGQDDPARDTVDADPATSGPGTDAEGQPVPQITEKQATRLNAPIRGMVISMLVLILLLLPFLWLQPKPDAQPYRANVDVSQEAHFAKDQASFTPADPKPGDGWSANYARWSEKSQDGVPLWNVGYLSPDYHLVDMVQTAQSNPTWLAQRTQLIPETGERTVDGVTWKLHHRDASGKQEEFTAWVGQLKDSTVVLSGKAPDGDFERVAKALSRS